MKKIKCKAIVRSPKQQNVSANKPIVKQKKNIKASDIATIIAYCLIGLFLPLFITQIPRPSSTTEVELPVVIINASHKNSHITLIPTGKSIVSVPIPEKNQITVLYENEEYVINDKCIYENFKNKINNEVTGVFYVTVWNNGNVTYKLISLYD